MKTIILNKEQESPAILEGVEQNDQSLNIKINKKKMFANKPPIIPAKQNQDIATLAQQKLLEITKFNQQQRAQTPDRSGFEPHRGQPTTHLTNDFYQRGASTGPTMGKRSNSHRPVIVDQQASQRPKSAKQSQAIQSHRQQLQRPKTGQQRASKPSTEQQTLTAQKKAVPNRFAPTTAKKAIQTSRPQTAAKPRPLTAVNPAAQQIVNQLNQGLIPASPATTHKKQGVGAKKKTDPVSRYQNLQNQWKSQSFLKASDSKQGRKLELDRFHKWSTVVHAQSQQTP